MTLTDKLRRPSALAASALLLLAALVPLLSRQQVGAYGLLTNRYVQMSSSADGSTTAGQDVTYEVGFTFASTTAIAGIVVDFCSDSPIIGDLCTAPTGFDVDATNLAVTLGGSVPISGFTKDTVNSTANTLVLTHGTSYSPVASETATLTLGTAAANDGVDNPENTNTTFYARIVTFTTAAGAQAYDSSVAGPSATNPGNEPPVVDAGGVALSTAEQITVTAKVQERLTFCVYTDGNGDTTLGDANTTNCTGVTGSAISLGDSNGVLYDSGPFVNTEAMYNVSTNASTGATIRVKGNTLTSGGSTIDAIGSGTTESPSAAGTEQFGFCTYQSDGTGLVIDAIYDGFDSVTPGTDDCADATHTAGTNATGGNGTDVHFSFISADLSSTYGDAVATKPAGLQSTGRLAFIGNIAVTTEPGIYTSTLTFIATGNY